MSEFAGRNRTVLASLDRVSTHTHRLELVEYAFEDGTTERYVEVHESWPDGQRMDRRVALTDAVHALLNLGEDELFVVGNRSPLHRTEPRLCADEPILSSGPREAKIARLYSVAQAAFDRAVVELNEQFDEASRDRHRVAHDTLAEMLGRPPAEWHFSALPDSWRRSRDVAILHWIGAGWVSVIQAITQDERGLIARLVVSKFDGERWVLPSTDEMAAARAAFAMHDAHERVWGTAVTYSKAVL